MNILEDTARIDSHTFDSKILIGCQATVVTIYISQHDCTDVDRELIVRFSEKAHAGDDACLQMEPPVLW